MGFNIGWLRNQSVEAVHLRLNTLVSANIWVLCRLHVLPRRDWGHENTLGSIARPVPKRSQTGARSVLTVSSSGTSRGTCSLDSLHFSHMGKLSNITHYHADRPPSFLLQHGDLALRKTQRFKDHRLLDLSTLKTPTIFRLLVMELRTAPSSNDRLSTWRPVHPAAKSALACFNFDDDGSRHVRGKRDDQKARQGVYPVSQ